MWSHLLLLAQLCNTRRELLIETPDERSAGERPWPDAFSLGAARPGGELLVEAHHAETGGRPNRSALGYRFAVAVFGKSGVARVASCLLMIA